MAVKKKQAKKSKKEIVKKKMSHRVVVPEIQQAPISESVGGPVVIPSGVLRDTPKEEPSQIETVAPKVDQPESKPQLSPQAGDSLASQPESATNNIPSVEPIATQDPFAVDGVVRDKPEQEHIEEPKKKKLWIIITIIFIIVVLIAGVLWYFRENAIKQISVKDTMTSTPSPSRVSPTPASDSAKLAIDYSKYEIKVLNGSGIGGAAAKGKEILESEKFVIEEIGNAKTSDYEKTIIQAKKDVDKAFLDKLKSVLEKTYLLDANKELEDPEEVDVVIIIGSGRKP